MIEKRILACLRADAKMGMDIATELFISRQTAWEVLTRMVRSGKIYRRFRHNRVQNCPDYLYSTVPFPPLYQAKSEQSAAVVIGLLGDIDAIDFQGVRR